MSATELLVIAVVALLVLGPDKLPDAMRKLGRATRELRRITSGFEAELRDALSDAPEPPTPKTAATPTTTEPTAPANPTAPATAAMPADPSVPAEDIDDTPESLPAETDPASMSAPTSTVAEGSSPSGETIA